MNLCSNEKFFCKGSQWKILFGSDWKIWDPVSQKTINIPKYIGPDYNSDLICYCVRLNEIGSELIFGCDEKNSDPITQKPVNIQFKRLAGKLLLFISCIRLATVLYTEMTLVTCQCR